MFEREHVYPAYILRYFSIKIFLFRWLPYVLKHLEHINISQAIPLLSFFQEPSTITKFMGEIFEINSIEDIKDMDMNFTHVNPLKIISYIHHISQCTRGPFFHTTQPLTKTNPKRRSNSKTKTPKSTHELTTNHKHTILCHIGARRSPSKSQKPQTNLKIIFTTSHVTPLTPLTPEQPPQQKYIPSFTFPIIFERKIAGATDKIQSSMHQIFSKMYSSVLYGPHTWTKCPTGDIFPYFTRGPLLSIVYPHFIFIRTLELFKDPPKYKQDLNRSWKVSSYVTSLLQRKFLLLEILARFFLIPEHPITHPTKVHVVLTGLDGPS